MPHSVAECSCVQYSIGIIGHTGGQMELSLTDTSSIFIGRLYVSDLFCIPFSLSAMLEMVGMRDASASLSSVLTGS